MTSQVALQVIQKAISVLADWADANLPNKLSSEHLAVKKAKEIISWSEQKPSYLHLLFDAIKLPDGKGQEKNHYCPAVEIADSYPPIPYPLNQPPQLDNYKKTVKLELKNLKREDWQNLSLLTLILEKYGSCLSFGELDVALIDIARSIAAVASALAPAPEAKHISLVAGDLSGIQKFIYTISSDGALKSLRARSFYLELVTEEVVQQLLAKLSLPRTSIIYAGGGNFYLLAPATQNTEDAVNEVRINLNRWLKDEFQGKVFLALASYPFPVADVANTKFAEHWTQVITRVNQQKNRKFIDQIPELLEPKVSYEQKCRVCHRDDTEDLKQLHDQEQDAVLACSTCRNMFALGGELLRVKAIVRSHRESIPGAADIKLQINISSPPIYYHLFKHWNCQQARQLDKSETVLLVNDWLIDNYRAGSAVPLLLGNYAAESSESTIMRAGEMAELARGIKRLGYLRMDVDNLGKIFAKGLDEKHSLPRLAGLSRQMSYFFKVYLNSLAYNRQQNLIQPLNSVKFLTKEERPNLVFIYAGGDDLFISGAWNEVVEFALDVYQSFRAYTGHNPDITLSGGISIADIKFPLYQAADESGKAENAAKGNGKDSLGLFGQVFKWNEWLGTGNIRAIKPELQEYLSREMPSLFGILPFVKKLDNVDSNYSRSFVRNLLTTAQVQEQMIKEIEEKRKQQYEGQERDIRYYLHLPKVAYTLARLPKEVLDDEKFRTSLKSPYNAPYFRAIATWIELLTRSSNHDTTT